MKLEQLKQLSELIDYYGIEEINRIIESNKEFLSYSNNFNILCSQDRNTIFLTNCVSSIICLYENILDLELLKNLNIVVIQHLYNYINGIRNLYGKNSSEVKLINYSGAIISKVCNIDKVSINDYKLIKLLLNNPEIYVSNNNPIIYAKSEKGYAYILGNKNNNKLKF